MNDVAGSAPLARHTAGASYEPKTPMIESVARAIYEGRVRNRAKNKWAAAHEGTRRTYRGIANLAIAAIAAWEIENVLREAQRSTP